MRLHPRIENPLSSETRRSPFRMPVRVDGFRVGEKIGQGTFGEVYRVVREETSAPFALKMYRPTTDTDQGLDATMLRELAFLSEMPHVNVIQLIEYLPGAQAVLLPLAHSDMAKFMRTKRKAGHVFSPLALRTIGAHLLRGIAALHSAGWMHRDVKPQNCLLASDRRVVQLGDFGLVRRLTPYRTYTLEAVTLWYRAPELLLGLQRYGSAVDLWAYGCMLAELVTGKVWCAGDSEIGQLFSIFAALGAPDATQWPGFSAMPHYQQCFPKPRDRRPLWADDAYPGVAGLREAADACLAYDPLRRPHACALRETAVFAGLPVRAPAPIEEL